MKPLPPGALLPLLLLTACVAGGAGHGRTVSELLRAGRAEPLLIAHRGLPARFPENTLASFRAALDAGAEMIELDVTLSSDGAVVVLHDETLDRTTDGRGPARQRLLAQLRALDAGAWFDARFAGERLPTLAEALDLVRGRCALNVEIKPEAVGQDEADGLVARVVRLIRERGMQDAVLISSFHPEAVARARRLAPEIRAAFLFHAAIDFDPAARLAELGADGLNLSRRHVTAEVVRALHAAGKTVAVYTVDEPDELKRLAGMGVDAIFTNDVQAAARALGRSR